MNRSAATTAAIICLAVLCGCSATPDQQSTSAQQITPADQPYGARTTYAAYADSVTVSPAWKQQIMHTITNLQVYAPGRERVTAILKDDVISADEMNALEREVIGCYAQHGMQVNQDYWFSESGGVGITLTDKYNEQISNECEINNGYNPLASYYYDIRRNPDQIDLGPYIFQCYQEHGLADKSLTYDEYTRLKSEGREPLIGDPGRSTSSQHAIWNTCWDDPLHNISSPPTGK